MPNSIRKFIIAPFSLIRDYGPKYCALKVDGIVPGRLSKLIIMSFLFLPNRGFSPKYYLFDSVLLSRIVSINIEQDFFFLLTRILVLDVGQNLKIKGIYKIVRLFIALSFRKYRDRKCEVK